MVLSLIQGQAQFDLRDERLLFIITILTRRPTTSQGKSVYTGTRLLP